MSRLVVGAIFRDEAPYLAEWIGFHRLMGVDHFYLYDNGSADAPERVLDPFLRAGVVTLRPWPIPFHEHAARRAYADCLERVRGHARWLACLDIDEFLFAPGRTGLLPALAEFAEHAGVVVHWQVYGSAGELHRRPEPVIRRFQHRAATDWIRNRRVKSIVDPERALHPVDCHHFAFRDGERAVTERGTPVDLVRRGPFKKRLRPLYPLLGPALLRVDPYAATRITDRRVSVDRLRINHYPVKSRQEFEHKARFKREKKRYQGVDYFAYHDRNEVHDPILVDVLPALEKELAALGGERGPED